MVMNTQLLFILIKQTPNIATLKKRSYVDWQKNQKIHDSNSSHLMSKTYNLYIISVRCCLKVSLDGQPLPQYDVFKKIKLKNEKLF